MNQTLSETFIAAGSKVTGVCIGLGGVVALLGRAIWVGVRTPGSLRHIIKQANSLGVRSLGMATVMSGFIALILVWQFGEALGDFGATSAVGTVSAYALVRELVPATLALSVGVRIASGIAAELGSMRVTEQIDAIAALGADPVAKLVWPRVAATTVVLPMLLVWSNVVALAGGSFLAEAVFAVPRGYFYSTYIDAVSLFDYFGGLLKGLVFGLISSSVGCYQGFTTGFGTEAVGTTTTDTVVIVALSVIFADFLLTMVLIPL